MQVLLHVQPVSALSGQQARHELQALRVPPGPRARQALRVLVPAQASTHGLLEPDASLPAYPVLNAASSPAALQSRVLVHAPPEPQVLHAFHSAARRASSSLSVQFQTSESQISALHESCSRSVQLCFHAFSALVLHEFHSAVQCASSSRSAQILPNGFQFSGLHASCFRSAQLFLHALSKWVSHAFHSAGQCASSPQSVRLQTNAFQFAVLHESIPHSAQ